MSDIIRLLPDSLANQIAAGEVVQRPASVVKELLENAIDAGASEIQLVIKDAGRTLVQVSDNGKGMSPNDARLCFERHATSKIRHSSDLFAISTFGFRGEAMASIAAVAQVEMLTKQAEDDLGVFLQIEASEVKKQSPEASAGGTIISVKNLFFNVPARRKFLKSDTVELKHVFEEVHRTALANPEIAFLFYNNDEEIYHLKQGNLAKRITSIFGKNYQERLVAVAEEVQHLAVKGFVGRPEFSKKSRNEQFLFVNGRFIKHNYVHHAIMTAYQGILPDDSFPFYALFIEIDPQRIDVNVHPTKTEVKFDDERGLYALVLAAVRQALGSSNVAPAMDFEYDVNFGRGSGLSPEKPENKKTDKPGWTKPALPPLAKSNLDHWEKLYSEGESDQPDRASPFDFGDNFPEAEAQSRNDGFIGLENGGIEITFSSSANHRDKERGEDPLGGAFTFQVHDSYVVSKIKSGLMLMDQQAAHERILYERYCASFERKTFASQQLLFPVSIELGGMDFAIISELQEMLKALGFSMSLHGNKRIEVFGIPTEVQPGSEQELIEGLLEQYKQGAESGAQLDKKQKLARALAKKSAIKRGVKLEQEQMAALIEQLFACANHNYSPDGQRIACIVGVEQIARMIG